MSLPLRVCLFVAHVLLILQGISCTIFEDTLLGIFKNVSAISANLDDSKENLETKTETENNKMQNIQNRFVTDATSTNTPSMTKLGLRNKHENTSVIDFISKLISTTPFNSYLDAVSFINDTGSNDNSNNKTEIHSKRGDITESGKLEIYNETTQPKVNIRYARSGDGNGSAVLQPEGYIYDLNNCQYVDNRVLCGYDKNPEPPKKKEIVDLDDLCRKHGDRIECGYVTGPYPDVYNLDPSKDKILTIDLTKYYNNIARSKHDDDSDSDSDAALRSYNISKTDLLLFELLNLRKDVEKLAAAKEVSSSTNTTSPAFVIDPTTPTTKETIEKLRPKISLADILRSELPNLTLEKLIAPERSTTVKAQRNGQKTCVEKDGRIFCRTI